MTKAIVLLSGGLDSATCMGLAKKAGYDLYALSFDYNQKHKVELEAARKVAKHYEVKEHLITSIRFTQAYFHDSTLEPDLQDDAPSRAGVFAGSALLGEAPVPKGGLKSGVAPTYVPGRNMIFLSFALGWADALGADVVMIGVNALDYSGYPDCRPAFINAMREAAATGTKSGNDLKLIRIDAPLIELSKKAIISQGSSICVPWHLTHSCYAPIAQIRYGPEGSRGFDIVGYDACGKCDSCRIRLKGFEDAGLKDPISYSTEA